MQNNSKNSVNKNSLQTNLHGLNPNNNNDNNFQPSLESPITATFPVMSTNTTTPNLNNCNDNNPTFTFVPAPFPVQQLQFPQLQLQNTTNPPAKPKRKQVKNACVNCQRACKKCDEGRPCQRCIKYELTDTCQDSIRKERKKGIKRGPYKRRTKTITTSTETKNLDLIDSPSTPTNIPIAVSGTVSTEASNINSTNWPQQQENDSDKLSSQNENKNSEQQNSEKQESYYPPSTATAIHQGRGAEVNEGRRENGKEDKDDEMNVGKNINDDVADDGTSNSGDGGGDNGDKDNDGSNLSVLSLVCSEMLDKSHDPTNINEKSDDYDYDDVKNKCNHEDNNENVEWYNEENSKKKKSSLVNSKGKRRVTTTDGDYQVNQINLSTSASSIAAATPPSKSLNGSCPLLFKIPANTYPVAPPQFVPVKQIDKSPNGIHRH
ncbi:336_t:CDS:2 [Entrophospora sp. SA101]|nr:336_t:CDS:2 [Entrophospora sp. SA101]